jgi:hypothetical protein
MRAYFLHLARCHLLLGSIFFSFFFLASPRALAEEAATGVKDAPPAKEKSAKPSNLFSIQSADGQSSFSPGLTVQLRYQYDSKDQGSGKDRVNGGFVEARRIRPTFAGTLFTEKLRYYLHMSTAPGSLELMDTYLDYRFHPQIQGRVGQWKIPFTRYRIASYKDLTFPDWAIVTRYFGADRQMGLAVHNGYEKPPRFEYEFGVFSGVHARATHGVGLTEMYGEKPTNPSDLANPGPKATVHPEVATHLAYNTPGIQTNTETDFEGGRLRVSAGLSAAYDLRPDHYQDLTLRVAPEVLVKAFGLSASATFYLSLAKTGDGFAKQHLAFWGGLAQASYLFLKRFEVAARYALVQTSSKLLDLARARADGIIAAETNADAKKLLETQYKNVGKVDREQEATIGFNVYIYGKNVKWQNDASLLLHNRTDGNRKDLRFRSQMQFAF